MTVIETGSKFDKIEQLIKELSSAINAAITTFDRILDDENLYRRVQNIIAKEMTKKNESINKIDKIIGILQGAINDIKFL
jgi:chaperonin cofactor prefoldin